MQVGTRKSPQHLIGHPATGFGFTMAKHNDAWLNLKGKVHQLITLRMRRQIKRIHGAATRQLAGTITKREGNPSSAGLEPAAG